MAKLDAYDDIQDEAVRAYHGDLQRLGIRPQRALNEDLQRTDGTTSYGGSSSRPVRKAGPADAASQDGEEPDFGKMTSAKKVQWNLERWRRILG